MRRTIKDMSNCTGTVYHINPDAPDEGTDIHHNVACPVHQTYYDAAPPVRGDYVTGADGTIYLDVYAITQDENGSDYVLATNTDDGSWVWFSSLDEAMTFARMVRATMERGY